MSLSKENVELILSAFDEGARQERERCANVAVNVGYEASEKRRHGYQIAEDIAMAIRAAARRGTE